VARLKRSGSGSPAVPLSFAPMNTSKTVKPIGRKALREALDTVPLDSLFSPAVSKELTGKQKKFARAVAMGETGASAYRKAYSTRGKTLTQANEASRLLARPDISAEVEAIKRAIAAQEYQTPAALRALVIHSLVKVITDPESKPGQITAAAKVLGTVTEVAAFTERKEVRTITSSEDARAKIMAELKQLANAEAVDAVEVDADSLLRELADSGGSETHRTPTPQDAEQESLANIHTIPHEQSPLSSDSHSENFPDQDPPPSTQDDPPSSFEK
jgi:hypothetical protein